MTVKIIKPPLIDALISNGNDINRFSTSTQDNGMLSVGTKSDNIYRTLLQFDLSSLPFFSTIINSTLNIFVAQNEFPDTAIALGVFQILSRWNPKNTTWNKQPLISSSPIDSISATNQDKVFLTFNITTLIQDWTTNRSANLGILLKSLDESHRNSLTIYGRNYNDSRFWPYLELNIINQAPPEDFRTLRAIPLEFSTVVYTEDSVQCFIPLTVPNVLTYDYTYLVVNNGSYPAVAYLQISPDGATWQTETAAKTINPGEMASYVAITIAKYAHLCYQSQQSGHSTTLTIYLQGRSYN